MGSRFSVREFYIYVFTSYASLYSIIWQVKYLLNTEFFQEHAWVALLPPRICRIEKTNDTYFSRGKELKRNRISERKGKANTNLSTQVENRNIILRFFLFFFRCLYESILCALHAYDYLYTIHCEWVQCAQLAHIENAFFFSV